MIKLGLVQAAACKDTQENLQTLSRFVMEASREGCEAVCFPECFLTGYDPEECAALAVARNADCILHTAELAKQYAVDILTGFMEKGQDACFITHGIFRKDGSCDFYRKTHLGKKESLYFAPGDSLPVFPLSCGLRVGFQLCVETHYPEITQTLTLQGAEVVFAPHAVPRVSGDRQKIWGKYITARSYDNRIYMACCNLWDETRFGGGCLVTDPRGEIEAACFTDFEGLLTFTVSRELVARYRTPGDKRHTHFYPAKRRPELYK